jgi:hypothetical protein
MNNSIRFQKPYAFSCMDEDSLQWKPTARLNISYISFSDTNDMTVIETSKLQNRGSMEVSTDGGGLSRAAGMRRRSQQYLSVAQGMRG